MGRAPCCDKIGLNKGPWSPQENRILSDFIRMNGHGNWRAVPKQAGLLRCGKSCRLRWLNYLRPEIKHGNFTYEEEETIIKLHQLLGNRWSAIASSLPGRTDNEIKNVWNTRLKKRVSRMELDPVTNHSKSPKAGHNLISLDYSHCSEKSPTMEEGNFDLIRAKAMVDFPTRISNSSDTFFDSYNRSSGILSSINSIDSKFVNGDSSLSLDWLESSCTNSFDEPIRYNHATEISTYEVMWEAHNFTSDFPEDDFLSCMDDADKDPHLLNNIELQSNDDDCDGFGYWLNILKQAGPSSTLL
ncbi:hypothetical protein SUGI_0128920 [Cryptomeria japonica]|uniref:transcription factor MYB13-like n=1 Tax=Cryptomeria japonica TaxID=3369 RepID=UPI002408E55E|nr:transcription factor MYB13-like [Cryptomeria japonica]GLJ10475.1 hypothetical protein SUGI_0128920 [Cryptomeria japonica]